MNQAMAPEDGVHLVGAAGEMFQRVRGVEIAGFVGCAAILSAAGQGAERTGCRHRSTQSRRPCRESLPLSVMEPASALKSREQWSRGGHARVFRSSGGPRTRAAGRWRLGATMTTDGEGQATPVPTQRLVVLATVSAFGCEMAAEAPLCPAARDIQRLTMQSR